MVQLNAPINCPICLDSGLVEQDGRQRVLTGEWSTVEAIIRRFKPCPVCSLGDKEWAFRRANGLVDRTQAA